MLTDLNFLPILNDAKNFKTWKEDFMLFLGIKNLDLALRKDQPNSSHEAWRDKKKVESIIFLELYDHEAISKTLSGDLYEEVEPVK